MPFILPVTYYFLLPHPSAFLGVNTAGDDSEASIDSMVIPYTALHGDDQPGEEEGSVLALPKNGVSLSLEEKLRLVKPMLLKYMLPLCKSSVSIP